MDTCEYAYSISEMKYRGCDKYFPEFDRSTNCRDKLVLQYNIIEYRYCNCSAVCKIQYETFQDQQQFISDK